MRLSTIAVGLAACLGLVGHASAYDALTFNDCPGIRYKIDPLTNQETDEIDPNKPDLTCTYFKLPSGCKQSLGKDNCIISPNPPVDATGAAATGGCGPYHGCYTGETACTKDDDCATVGGTCIGYFCKHGCIDSKDCDIGGECIESSCRYMQLHIGVRHTDMTMAKYQALTKAQKEDWDALFMQEFSFASAGSPSQFYIRDQFDTDKGMVQIVATQPYVARKDWASLGYQSRLFYIPALGDETSRLRTTFPGLDPDYPPCWVKLRDPANPFLEGDEKKGVNLIWTEQPCPINKFIDPSLA